MLFFQYCDCIYCYNSITDEDNKSGGGSGDEYGDGSGGGITQLLFGWILLIS